MSDGLTHYLHFLYPDPDKKGYLTIEELDPSFFRRGFSHGCVFVVPVAPNGDFFASYQADYVTQNVVEVPMARPVQTTQVSKQELEFEIAEYRFRFKRKGRVGRYVGKLQHPDFLFDLVEVETPEGMMDAVYKESWCLIVGCSSFHYREVDTSK